VLESERAWDAKGTEPAPASGQDKPVALLGATGAEHLIESFFQHQFRGMDEMARFERLDRVTAHVREQLRGPDTKETTGAAPDLQSLLAGCDRAKARRCLELATAPTTTTPSSASSSAPASSTASSSASEPSLPSESPKRLTADQARRMIEVLESYGATKSRLDRMDRILRTSPFILDTMSKFMMSFGKPDLEHTLTVLDNAFVLVMEHVDDWRSIMELDKSLFENLIRALLDISSETTAPVGDRLTAEQAKEFWEQARRRWHLTSESDLRVFKQLANARDGKSAPSGTPLREVEALITGLRKAQARSFLQRIDTQLFDQTLGPRRSTAGRPASSSALVDRATANYFYRQLADECSIPTPTSTTIQTIRLFLSDTLAHKDDLTNHDLRSFLLGKRAGDVQGALTQAVTDIVLSTPHEGTGSGVRRLNSDLKHLGLQERAVRGDGNCLFTSLRQAEAHAQQDGTSAPKDTKSDPTHDHWSAQALRVELLQAVDTMSVGTLKTISNAGRGSTDESVEMVRATTRQRLAGGLLDLPAPASGGGTRGRSGGMDPTGEIARFRKTVDTALKERGDLLSPSTSSSSDRNPSWGTVADAAAYAVVKERPVVCLLAEGGSDARILCDSKGQRTVYTTVEALDEAIQTLVDRGEKAPLYLVNRTSDHFNWAVRTPAPAPKHVPDPKDVKAGEL
jgi:hypothetical protein